MVVEPSAASAFIRGYSMALAEAHGLAGGTPSSDLLKVLASGREAVRVSPSLLDEAIASLNSRGQSLPAGVRRAIEGLRLRQWVYLRDTSKYSIFIDPEENAAYAVLGLTGPIRNILGGSGVTFRSGVVEYCGRYVCDGILESHAWLGSNYKRDFNLLLSAIKKEGRFYVACEL
jgi:hypothetical protein